MFTLNSWVINIIINKLTKKKKKKKYFHLCPRTIQSLELICLKGSPSRLGSLGQRPAPGLQDKIYLGKSGLKDEAVRGKRNHA